MNNQLRGEIIALLADAFRNTFLPDSLINSVIDRIAEKVVVSMTQTFLASLNDNTKMELIKTILDKNSNAISDKIFEYMQKHINNYSNATLLSNAIDAATPILADKIAQLQLREWQESKSAKGELT